MTLLESLAGWDRQVFSAVNVSWSSGFLDLLFPWVSRFGGLYLGIIPAGVVLLLRSFRALMGMGVVLGVTVLVYQVVKHLVERGRPFVELDAIIRDRTYSVADPSALAGAYLSFPSGHTTIAFCLASLYGRVYPRTRPVFYALACLVGLSRIYMGVHYLSDVAAGAALGLVLFRLIVAHPFVAHALGQARISHQRS